ESTLTNYLHEPEINALVYSFQDVTEREENILRIKKSERIYHSMAQSIPESAVILFDHDHRFLMASGPVLELMGYDLSVMEGALAKDILPADRYAIMAPLYNQVLAGEQFKMELELRGFSLILHFVPFFDDHNQVEYAMLLAIDVSNLKNALHKVQVLNAELEERVKERTQNLEIANKELESFSYSVSHDLRGPLRAINGYAEILVEDYRSKLGDDGKVYLDNIMYYSGKMGQLIDDLLDFSRIGKKTISVSEVDMERLCWQVWESMPLAQRERVDIEIEELPNWYGDKNLLSYVIGNLLSNAIKYSSKKEHPKVVISTKTTENGLAISIKDNGVGFDMKYYNKLFGVFNRLHSDEEFEGTGVGLAIVQRIVLRHQGKVWAYSEPGKGAEFFFTIAVPGPQTIVTNVQEYAKSSGNTAG
ncbi:MAG: PAS domain-containing protein, partial [Flavobacteriales bacterium]|nr:PAS domain-containing protein [Flavobacteriales bacterium]